jgi:EAL domain-containing protein (putative c-di-GMP-specific phosphodiesterase class I)
MDDFGAGFTSLAYLGDLALSEIKLDRAFTAGLTTLGRHRELVRATIDLCHALGLRVVAEGIEDQSTIDLLSELGCDVGQGYFVGRPCAMSDLRPLIDAAEHAEWAARRAS